MSAPDAPVIRREMGYTATEFAQVLPRAMRDWAVSGGPDTWRVVDGHRAPLVVIHTRALPARRVGALALPVLEVTLDLGATPEAVAAEFLRRFDRGFHRGGG